MISNKVQIAALDPDGCLSPQTLRWRDITTSDINDIVCDCSAEGYGTFMTTAEISDKLVIKGSIKKPMPLNRLGMILRQAGYQSKCLNCKVRGWIVRERDAEEVNANRNIEARE